MPKGIPISELEILDNGKFRSISKEDCPNVGINIPHSDIPFQVFNIIGNSCYIKCPLTRTLSCCGNKYPEDCQKEPNLLENERTCNLENQTFRYKEQVFNYVDVFGTQKSPPSNSLAKSE